MHDAQLHACLWVCRANRVGQAAQAIDANLVETGESSLMLGKQLRLEGAVAIARGPQGHFLHIPADSLCGMSVASIVVRHTRLVLAGHGLASQMDVHLGVEHALQGGRHHGLHQAVEVLERLHLGRHLPGQRLGPRLEHRIHARFSVRKVD
jgi:hypothetical protein